MIRGVVGNDVVDLTDPAIADHHHRERFVSRVCAPEERACVVTAFDLWARFAAKEAAYKALVKIGEAPGFRHREIRVARNLHAVRWREHEFDLSVTAGGQHVHAVAWSPGQRAPLASVARTNGPSSAAARDLLRGLVAARTGWLAGDLEIVRDPVPGAWDGFGPPRVEHRGSPLKGADVSLSHDGPFIAAAAIV